MLPSERHAAILNWVHLEGIVTTADICTHCNCSPATARRDLRRLEDQGLLRRVHGGAAKLDKPTNPPVMPNTRRALDARTALIDRVDVLIVTPVETTSTKFLVDRAWRAGVPIIAESLSYPRAMTLVAVDNYRAGLEMGRWASDYAQRYLDGTVNVLDVCSDLPNTKARSHGFADGLDQLPRSKRTLHRIRGGVVRETARQIAADALALHPEINVIFGINDDSALGALDAYRAAGLDDSQLVVTSFGLEGTTTKDLLSTEGPYKAGVAMFPEAVGRACVNAAVCAYHGCRLPDSIFTPFAIVTSETLGKFYERDPDTGKWLLNWGQVEHLPSASTSYLLLSQCHRRPKPKRIGYVQIYSSHEWYQHVLRTMQEHCRARGISLEVVDASQDMAHEIDALKRTIGYAAARFVREGDTVILDAGVTTAYLAKALRGLKGFTVITNSLSVLQELEDESGITLVSSGGVVRPEVRALTGSGAEASFNDLRADKAFIAGTGLSLDFGLSNTNIPEAAVKQAMIRAAQEVILLSDHTKIGVESLVKVVPLDKIHKLITDAGISAHDRLGLTQRGIEVTIAEEG